REQLVRLVDARLGRESGARRTAGAGAAAAAGGAAAAGPHAVRAATGGCRRGRARSRTAAREPDRRREDRERRGHGKGKKGQAHGRRIGQIGSISDGSSTARRRGGTMRAGGTSCGVSV